MRDSIGAGLSLWLAGGELFGTLDMSQRNGVVKSFTWSLHLTSYKQKSYFAESDSPLSGEVMRVSRGCGTVSFFGSEGWSVDPAWPTGMVTSDLSEDREGKFLRSAFILYFVTSKNVEQLHLQTYLGCMHSNTVPFSAKEPRWPFLLASLFESLRTAAR